ncbi:hypothetical protein ACHQM5_026222 [Ranunculus cassubicifolius]
MDTYSMMSPGIFEMWSDCDKGSLGFMELLESRDFDPCSLFDSQSPKQLSEFSPQPPSTTTTTTSPLVETSEVLNLPATPNSSSISSTWAEPSEEQAKPLDQEEENPKSTSKFLKPQKKNQKRVKQARFAFVTKSEVDHLEDGYRWRKYGQKAVKNSPFPRSYYRCTNATCGVKKRVERSCDDPSLVVTTYEGKHTHVSPAVLRGGGQTGYRANTTTFDMPLQITYPQVQQQQQQNSYLQSLQQNFNFGSTFGHQRGFGVASAIEDHGLLQDMVPQLE